MKPSEFEHSSQPARLLGGSSGLTLVELMVAMAIASVIMAASFIIFRDYSRSNTIQTKSAEIQQDIRAGLSFMEQEIRNAGLNPREVSGVGITAASSTSITFTADLNFNGLVGMEDVGIPEPDEQIIYTYNAANQEIRRQNLDPATAAPIVPGDLILNDVTNFSFTYLGANEAAIVGDPVPIASLEDIRTVVINIRITDAAGGAGNVSRQLQTRVFCRNLNL